MPPISVEFSGLDSRAFERKEIDASGISNAERRRVLGQQATNQIFFSSKVSDARLLAMMQDYIARASRGESGFHRDDFIKKARAMLGLKPNESEGNTIEDISSFQRLKLIYEFNLARIAGQIQYESLSDPDMARAFPALELYRAERRKVPRNWIKRWRDASGKFYDGAKRRMIAPVGAEIWTKISAFGDPFPPFDFNSGMGLRTIARKEAIRLGVIEGDGGRKGEKEAEPVVDEGAPVAPVPERDEETPAPDGKTPKNGKNGGKIAPSDSQPAPVNPRKNGNEGFTVELPPAPVAPVPDGKTPENGAPLNPQVDVIEPSPVRPRKGKIYPLDEEPIQPDPDAVKPIKRNLKEHEYVIVGRTAMLTGAEDEDDVSTLAGLVIVLARKEWKLVFKAGLSNTERKIAKIVVNKAQTKRFEKAGMRYVFKYKTGGNAFYAEGKVKDAGTLEIAYVGRASV